MWVWTCKALGREGPGALFESDPLWISAPQWPDEFPVGNSNFLGSVLQTSRMFWWLRLKLSWGCFSGNECNGWPNEWFLCGPLAREWHLQHRSKRSPRYFNLELTSASSPTPSHGYSIYNSGYRATVGCDVWSRHVHHFSRAAAGPTLRTSTTPCIIVARVEGWIGWAACSVGKPHFG